MRSTLLWLALITASLAGATITRADDRLVYSETSPAWLAAIGRLQVPGSRYTDGRREHFTEDCSATLVNRQGELRANTILTAWHCLEKYSDLSKPIRFSLQSLNGDPIEVEAYTLSTGGSIEADWALLRLHRSIPADVATALAVTTAGVNPDDAIVMAGYSRDLGIGAGGRYLTYDPACSVTAVSDFAATTDCFAYKGASGGPVIQSDSRGEPAVYGVISEGDSEGLSTFVPTSRFGSALRQHINGTGRL